MSARRYDRSRSRERQTSRYGRNRNDRSYDDGHVPQHWQPTRSSGQSVDDGFADRYEDGHRGRRSTSFDRPSYDVRQFHDNPRLQPRPAPQFNDLTSNHHLASQVLGNKPGLYTSATDIPFETVLRDDAPRASYRRRKHEKKSVIHWGQRKLLMCEMEFLTKYGDLAPLVVYAGAASGTHIELLAKYFPEHCFVCVDPAPFARNLKESDKMLLRQELFTDEVAKEFEGRDVLFMSDIRAADPDLMTEGVIEKQVFDDQAAQMRWHNIMKAKMSMLKFRLPYAAEGNTTYLKGEIWLPIWAPITTTEARLLVTGHEEVEYDNLKYEEQMFHFNTVTRVARYDHKVVAEGLDYCYDCRAEVEVLTNYLIKYKPELTEEQRFLEVARMSEEISRGLGRRTLWDDNSDPGQRKQGIAKRQYVDGRPAYLRREEREPQYSSQAQRMMHGMSHTPGRGLGASGQGMAEPVEPSGQVRTRGLGFDVAQHGVSSLSTGEQPAKRIKPMAFVRAGEQTAVPDAEPEPGEIVFETSSLVAVSVDAGVNISGELSSKRVKALKEPSEPLEPGELRQPVLAEADVADREEGQI
eukprot:m.89364 g.89364  ORF g.89364 m.89364 type:complete len:581 (+) comp14855_c0_seq28:189-1931(+)